MGTRFTITFDQDMDEISSGAFGLWLDSTIRADAEDDPESDHGPFSVTISTDRNQRRAAVTTELRGAGYRDRQWVDRHGWIWKHDHDDVWRGQAQGNGTWGSAINTEDQLSDYRLFGGRGPFLALA